ncbi:MAG: IS200/IS605 family transposase [Deltaproteobacteria bacterium]|nr:IS200/IS605 family transposase [Deltaproteobacteria bacterium]
MSSTLARVLIHVVFGTKNRLPLIPEDRAKELYSYIAGILNKEGCTTVEVSGMPDHVHVLLELPPRLSLAHLMQKMKGSSARWANQCWNEPDPLIWQRGYGAFSVSESQRKTIERYIQNQARHHQSLSFSQEWDSLLTRHGLVPEG